MRGISEVGGPHDSVPRLKRRFRIRMNGGEVRNLLPTQRSAIASHRWIPWYSSAFSLRAILISYDCWRFSQNSGDVPKKAERRKAVSAVILLRPFVISVMRERGSPVASESCAAEMFKGCRNSSRRYSPGWVSSRESCAICAAAHTLSFRASAAVTERGPK